MASSRAMSAAASLAVTLSLFAWVSLGGAMYVALARSTPSYMPWLIVGCVVCLFGAGWLAGYTKGVAPVRSTIATVLCILLIVSGVWSQVAYG